MLSQFPFSKVASLQACSFIRKRPQHRCFPKKFAKFLRTPFFTEHLRQPLLDMEKKHVLIHLFFWKVKTKPFRSCHFKRSMYFARKRRHLEVAFIYTRFKENCQQMQRFCCTISRSIKRSWLPRLWIFNSEISMLVVSLSHHNLINDLHKRSLETKKSESLGSIENNIYIKPCIWSFFSVR